MATPWLEDAGRAAFLDFLYYALYSREKNERQLLQRQIGIHKILLPELYIGFIDIVNEMNGSSGFTA